jgi:hypothetical protein
MATKSVIEIDILDEKFQQFAAEFEKIKKALGEMPSEWQKAFEPAEKGAKATSKDIENATKKRKDYNKALQDGNKVLTQTEKSTKNIAINMAETVMSATKWLGLSSLISIGGLTALARSVSNERTQGLGVDVPTGQLRAAKNVYGQLFDIDKNLESIAAARRDPFKSTMMERIPGINAGTQNPLEIYEKMMPALIRQFSQYQGSSLSILDLAYKSSGLSGVIPVEELYKQLNLEKQKPGSFENLVKQRESVTGQFTTGAATDEKWQQFVIALDNLTTLLKVNLVNGLTPLEPALKILNENLTTIINTLGPALQKFFAIFGWLEDTRKEFGIKLPHEYILENLPENKRIIESGLKSAKEFFSTGLLGDIGKKQLKTINEATQHFGLDVPINKITNKVTNAIDDLNQRLKKVDEKNKQSSGINSPEFESLLEKTKLDYRATFGKDLPIESTLRDRKYQQNLYDRWLKGEAGIFKPLNPADYPGREWFHQNNVDVGKSVPRDFMLKEGWKGGEPSDPVHYKLPKDTSVNVSSKINIFDNTGGNIIYQSSAMQAVT